MDEIIIDADARSVWEVFDDPANNRRWQPALKSQTHVGGVPGEVGAVYELVFDNAGRDIRAVATLTEKREFEAIASTVDSESNFARIASRFESLGNNQTRWVLDVEYRFKGLYKIVSFFLGKTMRARAADEMRNFKRLIESDSPDG